MKKRVSYTIDKTIVYGLDGIAGKLGLQKSRIVEMALTKFFEAADVAIADKMLLEPKSGKEKVISRGNLGEVLEELWDNDKDAVYDDIK